jgi:hypothetical protein
MKSKISVQSFEEVYKKIKQKQPHNLNTLFYYSLFDPSSYESDGLLLGKSFPPLEMRKEIEKNVISIIKENDKKFWKNRIKGRKKEKFLRSFVYSDKLCKYIIYCKLKENGIECKVSDIVDILIDNTIIEIKRLTSGAQLRSTLNNIITKYNNEKYLKSNFFLVLLFPEFKGENPDRTSQLIEIYYWLEDYLKIILKNENRIIKVLCYYITKEGLSPYNLDSFIERMCNDIQNIKGIK